MPLLLILLVGALLVPGALAGQDLPSVRPGFTPDEWIDANGPLVLHLEGAVARPGSFAVFIDDTDVTALFDAEEDRLAYRPVGLLLPAGEHELVVYHVGAAGAWAELGRFPMRVLTRRGFQEVSFAPKLDVANQGQVAEGHSPDEVAPARATYQEFTLNTGLHTRHVRAGLTLVGEMNILGVSDRERALRFAEMGEGAARFDLADYRLMADGGPFSLSLGNVTFGSNRHLIQGYGTRGLSAEARLGGLARVGLAAMAGRSIVGWHRPVGLGEDGSRILAGTVGLELVRSRPGALSVEGTFLDGSVLPSTGFNQGAVTDAERSRGLGVRVRAATGSGRLTLDAGLSRTRFESPEDPLLSRGSSLTPLEPVTRDARFVDAGVQLLQGYALTPTLPLSLGLGFRHERVDPLYRSVASYARADFRENALQLTTGIGPLSAQASYGRSRDNLDGVASILTTRTRNTRLALAMPLSALAGAGAAVGPWLPQLSYALDRVHQFGEGVPENSGFSESHVPDQISLRHGVRMDWYRESWRIGYQLDRSTQDNRQADREQADFGAITHNVSFGVTPLSFVDVSLDAALERSDNEEFDQSATTRRVGGSVDVRVTRSTGLSLQAYRTIAEDDALPGERTDTDLNVQLSQAVTVHQRQSGATRGQLFVRFARATGEGPGFDGTPFARRTWTLHTGFSLSLFGARQ